MVPGGMNMARRPLRASDLAVEERFAEAVEDGNPTGLGQIVEILLKVEQLITEAKLKEVERMNASLNTMSRMEDKKAEVGRKLSEAVGRLE
jgi:hypothetical protein